jgi:hypothetical protein
VGLLLIAVGLWVVFRFERVAAPEPLGYVIRKHPAADAGDKLVIAGALCLVGAAINNRGAGAR